MLEGISITAVLGIIAAYFFGEPLWRWGENKYKEFCKKRMFTVTFVDRPPPEEKSAINWYRPYAIPLGNSEHLLRVVCAYSLQLKVFDVRFLDFDEIAAEGIEPPRNISHIIKIEEVRMMPAVGVQGINGKMIDDQKGGIRIVIDGQPWEIAAKEPFTLHLKVRAFQDGWNGKISFRTAVDGIRRTGRCSVAISATEAQRQFRFVVPVATPNCVIDIVDPSHTKRP